MMLDITRYATCTTDGCGNKGAVIPVTTDESHIIICGVCSEQITSTTTTLPPVDTQVAWWLEGELDA